MMTDFYATADRLLILRLDCISALQYWRTYLPSSAPKVR